MCLSIALRNISEAVHIPYSMWKWRHARPHYHLPPANRFFGHRSESFIPDKNPSNGKQQTPSTANDFLAMTFSLPSDVDSNCNVMSYGKTFGNYNNLHTLHYTVMKTFPSMCMLIFCVWRICIMALIVFHFGSTPSVDSLQIVKSKFVPLSRLRQGKDTITKTQHRN